MMPPYKYTHYTIEYTVEGHYGYISFNLWNNNNHQFSFLSITSLDAMFFLNYPNIKLMNSSRTVYQIKDGA